MSESIQTGNQLTVASPSPPPASSSAHFVFFNERGLRAGWRLAIFLALLACAIIVLGTIYVLALKAFHGPSPQRGLVSPFWSGLGELVSFLSVAIATWIMGRIERRPTGVYGLPLQAQAASRFVTGYIFWGFLPITVVLLIMRSMGVFSFGHPGLSVAEALRWAVGWGFVFVMVGFFEEYTFRGYTLYTLADGIGFWPAVIIMALLFGRVHMGNGGESYIGIVGTILFALFASVTLWRTGNLWLAVGAHAGWDWGQTFFYGVNDSGLQAPGHLFNPPPAQGATWLSGGTVGPEGSIVTLIVWGLMTIVFALWWPREKTATASDLEER